METRRSFLISAGGAGLTLGLAACGGVKKSSGSAAGGQQTFTIGLVTPRSSQAAG